MQASEGPGTVRRGTMSGGSFAAALAPMRVAGYRDYTIGSTISLVGTWVQRVAQGWLVWQLTESPAWLGAVSFSTLGVLMVMSPITGVIADRIDRVRMSRIAQSMMLMQSLILATLVWTGWATPWLVLALAIYLGIGHAFHTSARLSLVPNLVPAELMAPAIAINSVIYQLATFIGPALAGLIIVRFGIAFAFTVNVLTFTIFLVMLTRVKLARREPPAPRTGFRAAIAEGFRYAAAHPGIRPLLIALLVSTFTVRAVADLLPAFSAQVFERGADGLAWLTSMFGLGAMLGGLWMAQRGRVAGLTRVVIGQMGAVAASLLLFVLTDWFPFALVALAAAGCATLVNSTGTQTLIQSAVAGHMRGRVMSVFNLILQGSPALGALAIGAISEWLGLRWPIAAGAVLCFVAWLWVFPQRRAIAKAMEQPAPAA
jgi:MFS family permease